MHWVTLKWALATFDEPKLKRNDNTLPDIARPLRPACVPLDHFLDSLIETCVKRALLIAMRYCTPWHDGGRTTHARDENISSSRGETPYQGAVHVGHGRAYQSVRVLIARLPLARLQLVDVLA